MAMRYELSAYRDSDKKTLIVHVSAMQFEPTQINEARRRHRLEPLEGEGDEAQLAVFQQPGPFGMALTAAEQAEIVAGLGRLPGEKWAVAFEGPSIWALVR